MRGARAARGHRGHHDANFEPAQSGLAYVYDRKGMYKEAISEWQMLMITDREPQVAALVGETYARSDYKAALQAWIGYLKQQSSHVYVSPLLVAQLYAMLGEKEPTLQWLEKAYQDRSFDLVTVKVDPIFDFLHSDSRFKDLLRRVGLTHT